MIFGAYRRIILLAALAALPSQLSFCQISEAEFRRADSLVTRLSPDRFPKLPAQIRTALTRGGFTIPQCYGDTVPHNVISGEFRKRGVRDWAVLASKNRISIILIFWGGSDKDTTQLLQAADYSYLQTTGDGIGFSRVIGTKKLNIEKDCIEVENNDKPPVIDHDAIEEGFLGKAAETYYFENGQWFSCATAD
jgi:hypothetical protein